MKLRSGIRSKYFAASSGALLPASSPGFLLLKLFPLNKKSLKDAPPTDDDREMLLWKEGIARLLPLLAPTSPSATDSLAACALSSMAADSEIVGLATGGATAALPERKSRSSTEAPRVSATTVGDFFPFGFVSVLFDPATSPVRLVRSSKPLPVTSISSPPDSGRSAVLATFPLLSSSATASCSSALKTSFAASIACITKPISMSSSFLDVSRLLRFRTERVCSSLLLRTKRLCPAFN
mmetsp:Transcript_4497/g.17705  ORF Transcript_4497/g.17705 Transcript_4497/m.17705 type:complete len:238 (-) Transcript_4497:144-857(-)